MIKKRGRIVRMDTASTTMIIDAERAEYIYYGERLHSATERMDGVSSGRKIFSTPGKDAYLEYGAVFENADGGFAADFVYTHGKILPEKPIVQGLPSAYGEGKTLELKYTDAGTKVCLYLYYTVYEDSDVIVVSSKLVNGSKKEIRVRRLMSLQMDLPGDGYTVTTLEGAWARERHCVRREINGGIFVNDSKRGMSSHARNPFVMLQSANGTIGCNLIYSGNHKETFETDGNGITRVLVGMNDFMFDWKLLPGESLQAPEAVICYAPDEDELSLRMHAFVSEHIVRGKWKKRERPILINNWEGTYFQFDEEKLLSIAKAAREVGIELFVLDDGWFGHRDDDTSSLGDWYDNAKKTGGGLAQLAEKIRGLGMSFGIWVEPEMISEDSDLYRAHPNYAMKIPGRAPVRMRNQLMLNMADEKVQNYVVRAISDVIARSGAEYVKWDFNRSMTDCYGKGIVAGEYFHRYMLGYYRVVAKLVKKFPNVLFEGCAGGGGRYDLGNLCYFPQYWTSDDTDARERIAIQQGTSYAYPQSTMGAHVSACPNHQTGNTNPLSARYNIAACGVLGYELDLTALSEADRQAIAEQVSFYKENRKLLQYGDYYRLHGKETEGFMVVSKDKNRAIAVVNRMRNPICAPYADIRFKGLRAAAIYEIKERGGKAWCAGGDFLMNADLPLREWYDFKTAAENSGSVMSRMFLLEKRS